MPISFRKYLKLQKYESNINHRGNKRYPLEKNFFTHVNKDAELLIIGGDMNNGKDEEVDLFLELISDVSIPIVVIFGNHDCDSGDLERIKEKLRSNPLIKILDGEYTEFSLKGKVFGIAGAKGYGGGFSPYRMANRGELATKDFLAEEEREVKKLQTALQKMEEAKPDYSVVVTHWAAYEETIEGEPKELYLVLGSSKLGDAITEAEPNLAISGHAHHGSSGIKKARGKISACNVAYRVNKERIPLFDFSPDGSVSLRHLESH